jgi:hypothetical protein
MQQLFAALFVGLQLLLKAARVLQKRDHRQSAHHLIVPSDGIHIDKIDLLVHVFLPGSVENGLACPEHCGQPGAWADLPQRAAKDLLLRPVQKVQIALIGKDDLLLGVNE